MPRRFIPPQELLSKDQYDQLSFAGRRVYAFVRHRLNGSGNASVRLWNRNLAVRATIAREDVQPAQVELCRAGLLNIQCVATKPDDRMMEYGLI